MLPSTFGWNVCNRPFNDLQERLLNAFPGHVTRTSSSLDLNSRTLLTEVQMTNPQSTLLPGMYAQVRLRTPRTSPPVLIPGDAVITGPEGLSVAVLRDSKIHIQSLRWAATMARRWK